MARGKKAGVAAAAAQPKKLSPEDQFGELAETVVADADAIKCSIDEQIEGYEALRDAISERLSSLKKERSREIEDDDDGELVEDDDDLDIDDTSDEDDTNYEDDGDF